MDNYECVFTHCEQQTAAVFDCYHDSLNTLSERIERSEGLFLDQVYAVRSDTARAIQFKFDQLKQELGQTRDQFNMS